MGVLLLLLPVAACDDVAPPPVALPSAAPTPAPPPAEAAPTPEPAEVAPSRAEPKPSAPPAAALPAADKATRSERLITHYRALHCLEVGGAAREAVAAAFVASALSPPAWTQALGELLHAMEDDPNGEIAQAIRAAHERPCAGGQGP